MDKSFLKSMQEAAQKASQMPPEARQSLVDELAGVIPIEILFEANSLHWGERVRELPVSVEGFILYYQCKFRRMVPPIVRYIWAPEFVEAYNNKTGVLLEGHRGSAKSTFLATWLEYVIGKRPEGSTQLIRINEQQANEADTSIAEIIEFNPGWGVCFPHVVPDTRKGWSPARRFIMDTRVVNPDGEDYTKSQGYSRWTQICNSDHGAEPSFLCSGITSKDIIGKHPSNGQYFDDFHDEGNTRSAREMQEIVDIIEKNIAHTWTRPEGKPILGVACTLWSEKDGYHALLKTGMFKHVKTPIFVYAENQLIRVGNEFVHPVWIDDYPIEKDYYGRDIKALWYPNYGGEVIRGLQRKHPVYFGLMYLCDMDSTKGKVLLKEWLHEYPLGEISKTWPIYFGIDFASTEDKLGERERDYFALAVLVGLPSGGAVVVDGFREHLGFLEAITRVQAFSEKYPTLATVGVEKWGAGEKFMEQLLYSSKLAIVPWPNSGAPVRSKGQRYQGELAPMFTDGRLWVADVKTPFLEHFVEEWISWDGGKTSTGHDDCMDAVYVGCGMAMGHLMPRVKEDTLMFKPKTGLKSAWSSLGRN